MDYIFKVLKFFPNLLPLNIYIVMIGISLMNYVVDKIIYQYYSKHGILKEHNYIYNFTEKQNCCICLEDFEDKEHVYQTECAHLYHTKCLNDWCVHNIEKTCPYCRFKITNDVKNYQMQGIYI